ncbi:peptidoglycan D,D-transpeptidase FtsI family protein [Candidatus Palauibacter sp.]|uniref:peptidoglycan D,D-transpeptidase FtsI family protein n=1 Tax=Candidatus Palauibacter sp. TaxID=3101350 RepID=UPI003B59B033
MTRFGIHSATQVEEAAGNAQGAALARTHRIRQRVLGFGITLVAVTYAVRLGELQIIEGDAHREKQLAQSAEWELLPAPRGRILDRRGRVLAAPDTRYQAFLAVDELTLERAEAIEAVAAVVPVSAERRQAIAEAAGGWSLVASDVSDEERVRMQRTIGHGVHFESRPARDYPRSMGRRLIGAVGADGRGGTGLEADLDDWLAGIPGRAEVRVDGHRNAYRPPGGQVIEAVAGHDVVLTVDAELQRIAENELARALTKTGASGGDMVLLDPRTGEILAVASERSDGAPDQVSALTDPYEPGSTMKPFLLASLLSEGVVDLDEIVDVEGGTLYSGSRVITDVHGYDTLRVRQIISKSSNVGAAKLAERLTPAVQHRYLRDFGFGMRTQLGHLAESPGRLSRPESWTALSPASHAIGYEMSATSLQLASAYGAIANGGVLMRPSLVREVRDPSGHVVQRFAPQPVRRVIPEQVAAEVRGVLEEVVRDGTGTLAGMAQFAVAGKTGTARLAVNGRYAQGRYRASFVGFAPADDPRIVILTRLEDPTGGVYYGGAIAAPTSQAALEAALATDGVQLDPRLVVSDARPRPWSGRPARGTQAGPVILAASGGTEMWTAAGGTAEPVIAVPDLAGLSARAAAAQLHALGLRVEWRGQGVVAAQSPVAGRELARGEIVVLK